MPELEDFVATNSPHVFAITESKLSSKILDCEISLPRYNVIRQDSATGNRRGGVAVYFSTEIPHCFIPLRQECLDLSTIEVVACELSLPSGRLMIASVYRNPAAPAHESSVLLHELWRLRQLSPDCLLIGDFNCPKVNWETGDAPRGSFGQDLARLADACLLHQVIRSPTRSRHNQTSSLLDLCFTRHPHLIRDVDIRDPMGRSDHSIITVTYDTAAPLPSPSSLKPRPNPHRIDVRLLH